MITKLIQDYSVRSAQKARLGEHKEAIELQNEFLTKVSSLQNVEREISSKLAEMSSEPCTDNAVMWLLAAQLHPSELYIDALCDLLGRSDECIWHEGIIEILRDLKQSDTVPCLERALHHELNYDPGRVVAIHVLEALADIGTTDAVSIIEKSLDSPHIEIREEAEILMDELK